MTADSGATVSVRSLSPFGERVGVRGIQDYRETLTPHPTPLPMGEGADRACWPVHIEHEDSRHAVRAASIRGSRRRSLNNGIDPVYTARRPARRYRSPACPTFS